LTENLTKNSNELIEKKIQETNQLEIEVRQLKEQFAHEEKQKNELVISKNEHISELV
jgi:hypothetical protein